MKAVEFKSISKIFSGKFANENVSFSVEQGSIHGIIGENGAGKSTAMKILFGLYQSDSGTLFVNEKPVKFSTPVEAMSAGIGMVHQHFMLAEPFSALENILLHDRSSSAFSLLDRENRKKTLRELAEKYNFQINWDLPVEKLSVGEQQRIEILKVLAQDSRILILDEPTAVLTPLEVQELFANLKKLKNEGRTILIITHKLKEVMEITDAVTIFRAGRVVAERTTKETSLEELAEIMVGQSLKLGHRFSSIRFDRDALKPVLQIQSLVADNKVSSLQDINLEVYPGEIVGIAGVEGNGQDILIQAILNPKSLKTQGKIHIHQQNTLSFDAGKIRQLGVGAFPEDRLRVGALPYRPVFENFLLGHHRDPIFKNGFWINRKSLKTELQKSIEQFDVRPNDQEIAFEKLSGGNQQKLVAARELWHAPKFLIAAQPTRGVDIGAIEFIHSQIAKAKDQGAGVLLVSSELDEILRLSDRVLVLYKGRFIAQFMGPNFIEAQIGAAMGGKEA